MAIKQGFDVEVDVRIINNIFYLGHDDPQYGVDFRWFCDRITKLWIHCKNLEALEFFNENEYEFNYFWHQEDDFTLTSKNQIWTYPNKNLTYNSICVLPELCTFEIPDNIFGICSDNIIKYK
jgi:hypothetical protein